MQHASKILAVALIGASLLLAGCSASPGADDQVASEVVAPTATSPGGTFSTIPQTTNRPSDPPLPSDYDQNTNPGLTAAEASLNQLWGITDSEVGAGAAPATLPPTAALVDFAAAITTRCYPIRTADEVAELERLKAGYEPLLGQAGAFAPAQAYFARATELCM